MTEEQVNKAVALHDERHYLIRSLISVDECMNEYDALYGTSDELTAKAKFEGLMQIMDGFFDTRPIGIDSTSLYAELGKVLLRHVSNAKMEMKLRLKQIEAEIKSL